MSRPPISMMIFGTIIFLAALVAWEWGELHGIDTTVLWTMTTPVVMALFLASPISKAAESASAAAQQTNGALAERIEAAVTKALGHRDAARTYQQQQDTEPTPARRADEGALS